MVPPAARPPRNARPAARDSWLMAGILGRAGELAFSALPGAEVVHAAVGDEIGQGDDGGDLPLSEEDVVDSRDRHLVLLAAQRQDRVAAAGGGGGGVDGGGVHGERAGDADDPGVALLGVGVGGGRAADEDDAGGAAGGLGLDGEHPELGEAGRDGGDVGGGGFDGRVLEAAGGDGGEDGARGGDAVVGHRRCGRVGGDGGDEVGELVVVGRVEEVVEDGDASRAGGA